MSQSYRLSQTTTSRGHVQARGDRSRRPNVARRMLDQAAYRSGGPMDVPSATPDESIVRLFEPDLITPDQHRDRVQSERTDQPEIRLMLAVMEDAVATYQRYAIEPTRRNQKLFEDA